MSSRPATTLPTGIAAMANKPVENKLKRKRPTARAKAKAKTKTAQKKRRIDKQPTKEQVVNGRSLPTTQEQAMAAACERRRRLIARDNCKVMRRAIQAQSKTGRAEHTPSPGLGPDMSRMPEFFDNQRFTKAEEQEGPVRCVCNVVHDDSKHMIQCETDDCNVWQHVTCMRKFGDAVPKNTKKGRYLCQVCDPWAHRERIKRIRSRDRVIYGESESKDW